MKSTVLFLVCTMVAWAAPKEPKQLPAGWPYDTIAHVVDGGTWSTEIVLANLDSVESKYKLVFRGDDGRPLVFDVNGRPAASTYTGTIPANGTVTLSTPGTSSTLRSGSAVLDTLGTDEVGIMAIFRQRITGRPDFEATVIGGNGVEFNSLLPFDNVAGYVTGVAILNPSEFSSLAITMQIRDEAGVLLRTVPLNLAAGTKQVFVVSERYPETAGKRGTLQFEDVLVSLSVLGFRFSPGGGFTTIPLMER